jgi:hypothetical protein
VCGGRKCGTGRSAMPVGLNDDDVAGLDVPILVFRDERPR